VTSVDISLSGFSATAIFPFHHKAIPEYFYSASDYWAEVKMKPQTHESSQVQTRSFWTFKNK
jgi:hypothetical protein